MLYWFMYCIPHVLEMSPFSIRANKLLTIDVLSTRLVLRDSLSAALALISIIVSMF